MFNAYIFVYGQTIKEKGSSQHFSARVAWGSTVLSLLFTFEIHFTRFRQTLFVQRGVSVTLAMRCGANTRSIEPFTVPTAIDGQ